MSIIDEIIIFAIISRFVSSYLRIWIFTFISLKSFLIARIFSKSFAFERIKIEYKKFKYEPHRTKKFTVGRKRIGFRVSKLELKPSKSLGKF